MQFPKRFDLFHAAKKPEKEAIQPLALKGGLNKD